MEQIKLNINIDTPEEELEKMYQEYLTCPEAVKQIKEMGISDDKVRYYIVKIYDFVNDLKYCSKCPGVSKCKKNNPLLCTELTYVNGVVDRNLNPCRQILEQMKIEARFVYKDYDENLENATSSKLDRRNSIIYKPIYDSIKTNQDIWVYLKGNVGTGKSFLAASILNDYVKCYSQGRVAFIDSPFRFKELFDYSIEDKEEFENMINDLSNCKILVIDDFGNEYKNDFVRDAILFRILSNRASKHLMTIFTSEYNYSEIKELYSLNQYNSGAQIKSKKLVSLIRSKCGTIIDLGDLPIY